MVSWTSYCNNFLLVKSKSFIYPAIFSEVKGYILLNLPITFTFAFASKNLTKTLSLLISSKDLSLNDLVVMQVLSLSNTQGHGLTLPKLFIYINLSPAGHLRTKLGCLPKL